MNDNQRVMRKDIEAMRAESRAKGLGTLALQALGDEPELRRALLNRQQRILRMLHEGGVAEALADRVATEALAMAMEQVLVLHRVYRAMWADLLPDLTDTQGDSNG